MEMPPKASEQLTGEELAWVREWIDAGAPWPEARDFIVEGGFQGPGQGSSLPAACIPVGTSDFTQKKSLVWMPLKTSSMDHHPVDWFHRSAT